MLTLEIFITLPEENSMSIVLATGNEISPEVLEEIAKDIIIAVKDQGGWEYADATFSIREGIKK